MATGVEALDAIVLAAGAGTRFGGGKLTADWSGAPLLEAAIAAAFAAPVRTVSVVWGADGRVLEVASRWASRHWRSGVSRERGRSWTMARRVPGM